jgi:hypothetical protein
VGRPFRKPRTWSRRGGEEVEECGVDLGGTLLLLACWAWLKTAWKLIGFHLGKQIGFLTDEGEASG